VFFTLFDKEEKEREGVWGKVREQVKREREREREREVSLA